MFAPTMLPVPIRSYLADFVARSRRAALLAAAGWTLVIFVAWVLLWCWIDRYAQLSAPVRTVVLSVGIAGAAWPLVRALLPFRRKPDWIAAALAIEQVEPRFNQRLITITSQALLQPDVRGSDAILSRLEEETGLLLGARTPRAPAVWRPIAGPWAIALGLAALGIVLLLLPGVRFGQLVLRSVAPLAHVPAVTTTQITLLPGNADVVQSQPLNIEANVWRVGESRVTLLLSEDGRSDWSRLTMTPAGAGAFRFSLATVDRDVRYCVSAGDATTPVYTIRVLRRPAVARFNIRYDYPSYTRLPPAYVTNDTGRIEAPVGTRAALGLVSTEPLGQATISIDGRQSPMQPAGDATTWQTTLEVRSNQTYSIDLLSTRHVIGAGPGEGVIRALPDLPPHARLVRGGDSVRLSPHEIVPVAYDALDDYGLQSLALSVQVNGQERQPVPIRIWGDPRRQQDTANVDLARLGVQIGDVVGVALLASDTGGHEVRSQPLQVLISPASIDLDAYQRMVELQRASQLAQTLAAQLQDAAEAEDQVAALKDHPANANVRSSGRRDRALSAASQTAAVLRQPVLRCVTHSPAPLSGALEVWIDATEVESAAAMEAFRQSGTPAGIDSTGRRRLHEAVLRARQLSGRLTAVGLGEQAAAAIADRQNLAAAQRRPVSPDTGGRERLAQTLERMHNDMTAELGQLGLDPSLPNLEAKLAELVAAESAILAAVVPVDFAAAADQWAHTLRRDSQQRGGLEARLSAAAQAEAIRSDADLTRARDLELASRAVAAVNSAFRAGAKPAAGVGMPEAVARDIQLLISLRRSERRDGLTTRPAQSQPGQAARIELAKVAGDSGFFDASAPSTAPGNDPAREAEGLAMEANAAAAQRQYESASRFESALVGRVRWRGRHGGASRTLPATNESDQGAVVDRIEHHRQAALQEMTTARRLDDLDQRQQAILTSEAGASVAQQQQSIADQIPGVGLGGDVREDNTRDRATTAILSAEEQLAALPQVLADSIGLAAARRDASARAVVERVRADRADASERDAAVRAADEAGRIARDATVRLTAAARPLAAPPIQSMAQHLGACSPEADAARDSLLVRLVPALQSLEESLSGDDPEQVDRDAADTREAIAYSQRELAAARELLVKRDPLVAARWFARAAAESLSAEPPDLSGARRRQAGVSQWLSRAWDQSIHRAAQERLAILPSLAGVLGQGRGERNAGSQEPSSFAAARQWDRMRQDEPALESPAGDSEPPGYEQSLKLYFEALGKAQEGK